MSTKWIYAAPLVQRPRAVLCTRPRGTRRWGTPPLGVGMRHLTALLVLVGLALLGSAGLAAAHNELIGSDPSDGARVAAGPARVSLTFNLPVQRGFSTVVVTGPDGGQWQSGAPAEDGAVVSAPVRPLGPAGQYTVAYQVLSADGHRVRGAVRFTLTPGTGTVAAPPLSSGRSDNAAPGTGTHGGTGTHTGSGTYTGSGGAPRWPWLVGAGALLVAGVVGALRVRRTRG